MTRKEAREEAFRLLFETEFHGEDPAEEIYARAREDREIMENPYIREVYFGVRNHVEELDEVISRHSDGWKPSRISPVSLSALRLCIYEMQYMDSIPHLVSINEAIELVKTFDDPKMKAFVNGVLNGAKDEIEAAERK